MVEERKALHFSHPSLEQEVGALIEPKHPALHAFPSEYDCCRYLPPLRPEQPLVVNRAEALILPGVEPSQKVSGERAQHVGARDLGPCLLAERGPRPVLPLLARR